MASVIKAFEYAKEGDFSGVLHELEQLPPDAINRFGELLLPWAESSTPQENALEYLREEMSSEQWDRWHYLASSEREREYLMAKAQGEELSDNERRDLRASDF